MVIFKLLKIPSESIQKQLKFELWKELFSENFKVTIWYIALK
jgi:hypothetical protein